ncbi:MAG TPA: glycosyl hydrolase family 28-related protein, partial [Prolixibacteraceae bacterium]|nr:glycosyl hydrolase family 28-related protein [Prolixibacteraceae bacterium]
MSTKVQFTGLIFILSILFCSGADRRGAHISWITFEAEDMNTSGKVMGPTYEPYRVETESSGQRCVMLQENGQWVELTSTINANSMVLRYSLPDSKNGGGLHSTLGIYVNGKLAGHYHISSQYTHLYGKYPFTNAPGAGKQRNFYDEIRVTDLQIVKGDVVKIERDDRPEDNADFLHLDLVDLENTEAPLMAPFNSLSITDREFTGNTLSDDYTEAFRRCIAKAVETGKIVWIPAGRFKISGDIILPEGVVIQGAGMWHSVLEGDESVYFSADRRVRLKGNGSTIHLSDFAIT